MLKSDWLQTLKASLETLERESPTLLKIGAPISASTFDGLANQCKLGLRHKAGDGYIVITYLISETGFMYSHQNVDFRYALNLIRTFEKRKS